MGTGCSNVKTVTHPAFSRGRVKAVDLKRARVKIACASGHTFDHPCDAEVLLRVQRGDPAFTYMTRDGFTVTFLELIPEGEVGGKGHISEPDCILFTRGDDQQLLVFPIEAYKSSVDIRGRDVDCVLSRQSDHFEVRVTHYNPFLFYPADTLNDVRLISRYRLKLNDMAKSSPNKQNKHSNSQFQRLGEGATAYRKVKHDGNAYYRCLVTLLMEHLCRKTTPMAEFDAFLEKVENRQGYFALIPEHEEHQARLLVLLHNLRKVKAAFPSEAMVALQPFLQDPSVDMSLINYFRLTIANFIALHHRQQRYKRFIVSDIKEVIRGVMKYGVEAEGLVKYAAPELLGLLIVQLDVSIDSDEVFETYYSPSGMGKYPIIKICKSSSSTYHALYTEETLLVDGYDIENHTYSLRDAAEADMAKAASLYHEVVPSSLHAIVT